MRTVIRAGPAEEDGPATAELLEEEAMAATAL